MKTIVYLHGLGGTGKIFNHLRSQLPEHSAKLIDYDSSLRIEESVDEMVKNHFPRNTPFSIVGHSLGGIMAKLVAIRHADEFDIEQVISISTPFGGSDTASKMKWFFPSFKILKDLSPGSVILKEVADSHIRNFTSIISTEGHLPYSGDPNDGVVSIQSQKQTTSKKIVEVKANHFEVVQDEKTIATVKKLIFGANK